ncbi:hypothetical protein GLOIN_2v1483553 [Rhizophagus clarus]|uniref:Uncharacterized protein n=1 Tax=Rhizophagus clarus TaxID=94130 RepID=A0A8H3MGL1_9GLOM|nr:hypothetical protein GLOIN_2v1483553 [Rhizophagus clarus]
MFYAGTADPRKKMTAAEMQSKLTQRVQEGEIEENKVLKKSTIANWINSFHEVGSMQWHFKLRLLGETK